MQMLALNFFLYTISGMWRPIKWSSKCLKMLYNVFTCFVLFMLIFLMLAQLLDIILVIDNIDDFAENALLLLSVINVMFKIVAALTRRDKIVILIETLQKKPCRAYNEEESDIQMKFDRLIRSYSINYISLALFSASGGVIRGVLSISEGQLPFRLWLPYDYTPPTLFYITLLQEILALLLGTIINIATETTVLGFCLQICAQFEILKHRLQRMAKEKEQRISSRTSSDDASNRTGRLSEHILHHLCIIRLAKMINNVFSKVIFVQFFVSILVICLTLYHVTSHMRVIDIVSFTAYIFCMFVQIFVYCWAGNEVILKSTGLSETIYQIDWILMPLNERKDLLMIMKRSTRPIKLSSSFLVTLSLESYGKILKASYSAFNLLQQS